MSEVQKLYKFYFVNLNNDEVQGLIHDVDGWKDFGLSVGRGEKWKSLTKTYTANFTFIEQDATYLKYNLFAYGVNSLIKLRIDKLTDWRNDTYTKEYEGYLDLSESQWDSNTFSAPLKDGGLYSLIESKFGTEYNVQMNDLIDNFTGAFFGENIITEASEIHSWTSQQGYSIDKIILRIGVDGEYTFFKDIPTTPLYSGSTPHQINIDDCFAVVSSGYISSVTISFLANLIYTINKLWTTSSSDFTSLYTLKLCYVSESKINDTDDPVTIDDFFQMSIGTASELHTGISGFPYDSYTANINFGEHEFTFSNIDCSNGMCFLLLLEINYDADGHHFADGDENLSLNYSDYSVAFDVGAKLNINKKIQVVRQSDVFQSLITQINSYNISATETESYNIAFDLTAFELITEGIDGFHPHFLTCGLGLRGINRDDDYFSLKTSLDKFLEFVYKVYGYVLGINYDDETDIYTLYLYHEDTFYREQLIKKIENIKDVKFTIIKDMLYTAINVGYETDNDTYSGLSEYNCKFNFLTPNFSIDEKILDFVSPYCASIFKIETYIYENYRNWEDGKEPDSEIYVVCGYDYTGDGTNLVLDRTIVPTSGIQFPETCWNLAITPKRILNNHANILNSYFGFSINNILVFNTADKNGNIVADTVQENANITVGSQKNFMPIQISFSAPADSELLKAILLRKNGYFQFDYEGQSYKTFLKEDVETCTIIPFDEKNSEFNLIAHKDNLY